MDKKRILTKKLEFSEKIYFLDYMEHFLVFLQNSETNLKSWKWTLFSLYGFLYSSAVCYLKNSKIDLPETVSIKELIVKSLQKISQEKTVHFQAISKGEWESIEQLEQYSHIHPSTFTIELKKIPKVVFDGIKIIKLLTADSVMGSYYSEAEKRKLKSILFRSKNLLLRSKLLKIGNPEKKYVDRETGF